MKLRIGLLTLLSGIFFVLPVWAETGVTIANDGAQKLSSGNGYEYYKIDGDKYAAQYQKVTGETTTNSDRYIYAFEHLGGVKASSLPAVIKEELYALYGVDSGDNLTAKNTGMLIIDVAEAQKLAARINKHYGGYQKTASETYKSYSSGCGGRWYHRSESGSASISPRSLNKSVSGSNGFSGNMQGEIDVSGTINYKLAYSKRSNRCFFDIPYGARVDDLTAQGNITFGQSQVNLSGTIFEYSENVFKTRLINFDPGDIEFMVGPVLIILDFEVSLDAGLDVYAKAGGNLNYIIEGGGEITFDLTCTTDNSCVENEPTVNTVDFSLDPGNLVYDVTVEATAMPYIQLTPGMSASIYSKSFRVAEVYLPLTFGLPVSYWYHHSAGLCGDADGDGYNESVTGKALFAELQLQALVRWDVLFWDGADALNLPMSDRWRDYRGVQSGGMRAARKLVYFDDRQGSSNSAFSPRIVSDGVTNVNQGGIVAAARECYPWNEDIRYKISWGDGTTTNVRGPVGGVPVAHQWPSEKTYTVTVRTLDDYYGRDFDNPPTSRSIQVNSTAQAFDPPGAPSSISVPESGTRYGKVSVGWGAASGPVTDYELWRFPGLDGEESWDRVFKGNSRSFKDTVPEDGHYQYKVKACNGDVCGVERSADDQVHVLIAPSIPPSIGPETGGSTDGSYEIYWEPSATGNLTHYELQVSLTNDFSSNNDIVYRGLETSYMETHRAENYYWYRVRGCNQTSCSNWRGTAAIKVFRMDTNEPRR